jgi:hypothetical protein
MVEMVCRLTDNEDELCSNSLCWWFKVTLAEKYQRPYSGFWGKFGLKQYGVVTTLANGKKYMVRKYRGRTQVLDARFMTSIWKKTESKKVEESTFKDFVKACRRYYWRGDTSDNAANRMMMLI